MFAKIKFIIKCLLIVVFFASLLINITIFSTSYGSLLLRYDETKFVSMIDISSYELSYNHIFAQKENGISLTIESNDETSAYTYYVDNESNVIMHLEKRSADKTENYYYFKNIMYKIDNDGYKTQSVYLPTQLISDHLHHLTYISSLLESFSNLVNDETKRKIEFSFSPLYVIGIGSSISSESSNIHLSFDLKGDLRKLNYTENDKTYSAIITYNVEAIILPDLNEF